MEKDNILRKIFRKRPAPELTDERICELCGHVERVYGRPVQTAGQFEKLAEDIYNRTGTMVSSTTLKRVWGYLRENQTPRVTTFDILARYAGWQDVEDFLLGSTPEIESGSVGITLNTYQNMVKGEVVRLLWSPSRVCDIEFLGEKRWKVVYSEGTRLQPGDTFTCGLMISGEPLYMTDVVHVGAPSGTYVCGRKNGVTFVLESDSDKR